jgi:hypothetical protein
MDANRITVCESVCTSDVVTDRHTNDWPITCADCITYGITYGCTFCVSYGITDDSTYGIADVSADCCTDGGSYG